MSHQQRPSAVSRQQSLLHVLQKEDAHAVLVGGVASGTSSPDPGHTCARDRVTYWTGTRYGHVEGSSCALYWNYSGPWGVSV
jgi:hypothetical protein